MPVKCSAVFSLDRFHRYTLHRIWNAAAKPAMFIGLNPSTADEFKNDPTVTRCINFARDWGYGGLIMTNAFAYRSTDPKGLTKVRDPVGPENDKYLKAMSEEAGIVVAAWGVHGTFMDRDEEIVALIPNLYCLGTTKDGNPRHPLYLRKDLQPVPWSKAYGWPGTNTSSWDTT